MTLSFFNTSAGKKNKSAIVLNEASASYPRLASLMQTNNKSTTPEPLEPEEVDENFFYKHITTHFHSLFCDSAVVCIPHSKSIQGLVITKDIIESHCFQRSPFYCNQFVATKQRQKIIALEFPIITTIFGFKEQRTVNIMAEETVYLKKKKIRLISIDRLLEGNPSTRQHHQQHAITIPPNRNSRTDLEFLNMFSENLEALYELRLAIQEFTDSYVYIKGFNRDTVERIQHMYMKTYRTILERNTLLQNSCRIPSEHDRFLELVENVVMGFLHKKIWVHTLQSLLASQDSYLDHICDCYDTVELSQYSLRHPISEMRASHFRKAIDCFQRIDCGSSSLVEPYESTLKHLAFTPLEKLEVVKSTLELISSAVADYIEQEPSNHSDSSVTADEMIPLLAFVIVQSNVSRIASSIYYMQYYRLARMIEGSAYSFVVTTIKSAIEFLKGDPLFILHNPNLTDHSPSSRTRSTSLGSTITKQKHLSQPNYRTQHRKTQSADLYNLISNTIDSPPFGTDDTMDDTDEDDPYNSSNTSSHSNSRRNSAILRPYMVLPRHHEGRKSLDIPHDWLTPQPQPQPQQTNKMIPSRTLAATKPMIQTTFPKISNSTPLSTEEEESALDMPKLGRSLSASTVVKSQQKKATPPTVINLRDRVSFDGMQRPASICLDTRSLHSIEDSAEDQEELMGDFLMGLSKLDGNVVGGRSGSFKTFKRP
ncbi:hypothetical protein EDC96DRAFT_497726 [Choanephora cucurbitarum]|nr:hypothetical protein EDC96DRAFT_497726 [Choanephora cucurbitarum]